MFNLDLKDLNNDIEQQNRTVNQRIVVNKVNLNELSSCEENFYSLDKLDELAEEIKVNGLQNPIKVTKDNEIVSGHRRFNAYKLLSETDEAYNAIPTIFIDRFDSEEEKLIYLISENSSRIKSKHDVAEEMRLKKKLYHSMKKKGNPKYLNANINKLIADEYGVSEATVKRSSIEKKEEPKDVNVELYKKIKSLNAFIYKNGDELEISDELVNMLIDFE